MKAYLQARKCRSEVGGGRFKIDKDHTFKVPLVGLIGKLPKSDDIKKTVGDNYDILSAFQAYFLL